MDGGVVKTDSLTLTVFRLTIFIVRPFLFASFKARLTPTIGMDGQ